MANRICIWCHKCPLSGSRSIVFSIYDRRQETRRAIWKAETVENYGKTKSWIARVVENRAFLTRFQPKRRQTNVPWIWKSGHLRQNCTTRTTEPSNRKSDFANIEGSESNLLHQAPKISGKQKLVCRKKKEDDDGHWSSTVSTSCTIA